MPVRLRPKYLTLGNKLARMLWNLSGYCSTAPARSCCTVGGGF